MARSTLNRISLLALPMLVSASLNAATVTDAVGVVKLTIAAAPAAGQSKLTAISATLRGGIDYQATATSVGTFASTSQPLNTGVTTWTATQWTAEPHLCYIENAAGAEEAYLITAMDNSTGALTLATTFDFSTRYPATPTYRICKANTLGNIFTDTSIDINSADRVYIWNGTSWDGYLYLTHWRKTTALSVNANDTVVFPDEGLLVSRSQTSDLVLTLNGSVPTKSQVSTIPNAAFVSTRYPVGTTLDNTGIQDSNWTSSDRLYIWNGSNWDAYLYLTYWRKTTALSVDASNTPVNPDSAMFVTRGTPLEAASADVSHSIPYTP